MSQVQTIFKNMSWLLISQIIASVCGFIWTILMARYLGVSNYGIFGFATSLTGILSILMDLGISTHIVRHISTDYESAPKYLGNAIPLKSIFSIVTIVLTLIILILMKSNELVITVTMLLNIPINKIIARLTDADVKAILPINGAVILVIISIILTVIAGLIPSKMASKRDPVESLRSE